ncbi:MAG: glycosyltransferase family 39 protein [Candidatus Omnitrophota bacterium]
MPKGKWFESDKILLSLLILLSAGLRIFFLLKFDNMPGDAAGHVERALRILENPNLLSNFDGNSSTLYKYSIASFMYFWRDPVLAPRVFTALFGIFLVVPYYGTLKVLFDRTIAFFSTLMLVFYPLHVIQSSVATSDAVYYFFLFSAFYYLFSYKIIQKRLSALLLSALSLNIASLLRFECWIFIPVFFMLLWPKGKKPAFLFLILSLVFPCGLFAFNQFFCHDFFYSFDAAGRTAHAEIAMGRFPYDPRWWSWLDVLWRSSGPSLVIGGLSGIVLAFLTRQKRQLSIFFLVLWLAFTINTLSARMVCGVRYSIILGLFLIPYAWFFIDRLLAFVGLRKIVFFILALLSILTVDFAQALWKEIPLTTELLCVTPSGIKNIAKWLKDHVQKDEFLVIEADSHDGFPSNILLRSGIHSQKCTLVYAPLFENKLFENKEKARKYFLRVRPKYLVLNSGGYLKKVLSFDLNQQNQSLGNISFKVVFEQYEPMLEIGKYIIYKISYPEFSGGGGNA